MYDRCSVSWPVDDVMMMMMMMSGSPAEPVFAALYKNVHDIMLKINERWIMERHVLFLHLFGMTCCDLFFGWHMQIVSFCIYIYRSKECQNLTLAKKEQAMPTPRWTAEPPGWTRSEVTWQLGPLCKFEGTSWVWPNSRNPLFTRKTQAKHNNFWG